MTSDTSLHDRWKEKVASITTNGHGNWTWDGQLEWDFFLKYSGCNDWRGIAKLFDKIGIPLEFHNNNIPDYHDSWMDAQRIWEAEVEQLLDRKPLPTYDEWTDEEKVLFKLWNS